jgi:hypothetical protein
VRNVVVGVVGAGTRGCSVLLGGDRNGLCLGRLSESRLCKECCRGGVNEGWVAQNGSCALHAASITFAVVKNGEVGAVVGSQPPPHFQ